eukprot:NODE_204_length_14945_cov_0.251313.p3 type:complete len:405 gc:universal NODE_204_length_14945_cov_0.251313:8570-7356(-)
MENLEIRIHEATNYLEACQSNLTDISTEQWQNILNTLQLNKDKINACLQLDFKVEKQISEMEKNMTTFINKLIGIRHRSTFFKNGKPDAIGKAVAIIAIDWQTFLLHLDDRNEVKSKGHDDLFIEGIQLLMVDEIDLGKRQLEESFRLGNIWAGMKLAEITVNKKDSELYLRNIEHPKALFELGNLCEEKGLVSEALVFWQRAYKLKNNMKIQMKSLNMNICLKIAEHTSSNEVALELLDCNIKQNHPNSLNYLGYLYYNGERVEQNFSKAFELFQTATKLGNIEASNNIGICYEKGRGTELSDTKAMESYEKVADLHAEASSNLGYLLFKKARYSDSIYYLNQSIFLGSTNSGVILDKVFQVVASDSSKLEQLIHNPRVRSSLIKKGNIVLTHRSLEKQIGWE